MYTSERHSFLRNVLFEAHALRGLIEPHFGPETAAPGWTGKVPSAGHCAVVSALLSARGLPDEPEARVECVSVTLESGSHWFNRVTRGNLSVDIDLTGDQFGHSPVRVADPDDLYEERARLRKHEDLNEETLGRARMLAQKAGLDLEFGCQMESRKGRKAPLS